MKLLLILFVLSLLEGCAVYGEALRQAHSPQQKQWQLEQDVDALRIRIESHKRRSHR